MNSDKNIEQKLETLADALGTRNSFVNDVMDRIEDSPVQPGKKQKQNHVLRRIKMKSISKFVAAAIVIIGISAVFLFNSSPTGVAWANVIDNTNKNGDFAHRRQESITILSKGYNEASYVQVYTSPDYGTRLDIEQDGHIKQSTFTLLAEKSIIVIMPSIKKFKRVILSDTAISKMKQDSPVTFVKKYIAAEHKSLGRKVINGIEAEGIEVDDIKLVEANMPVKSYTGRLWVDVQTELPVLLEAEIISQQGENNIQVKITLDSFQWNADLSPDTFKPDIPEDYTEL